MRHHLFQVSGFKFLGSSFKFLVLVTLLLCHLVTLGQPSYWTETAFTPSPKYEVRAVWLTTIGGIDWPHTYANSSESSVSRQKAELTAILDQLQADGINVVLLQTRIRATTIYPSALEPWDGCLSGTPGRSPGYDALQFAIDECHKRGMQLHAWVVTIPVGKWNSTGCTQLRKRYPRLIKKIGPDGFMDPEQAATGTYLADLCEEIVRNYDVDGIHLDYIRYPETWKIKVSRQQGRRNITNIAETISRRVRSLKPWVMMSCSPIGKADDLRRYSSRGWNARTAVCQDAQEWLRTGVMDALFPMMYFRDNHFYPFAIDWKEQSHGKILAPGVATYMLHRHEGNWPLTTVTQELNVLRQLGMGHTHFRSKFLTDNTKGIQTFTRRFNHAPALVPPMTWKDDTPPAAPIDFQLSQTSQNEVQLSWKTDNPSAEDLLFNVYASRSWPVDVSDAANLVRTRLQHPCAVVSTRHPKPSQVYYAVTAVDRYGNESQPLQSLAPAEGGFNIQALLRHPALLPCNGSQLQLPEKPATLDADMLLVQTLQGRAVMTIPYKGTIANVSRLPEGVYQLRSLNRRGITHRLGFFAIRR